MVIARRPNRFNNPNHPPPGTAQPERNEMIKFNKYNVTNTETKKKNRVHYSVDNRIGGRKCVTMYAKDYTNTLEEMFPGNFTDNFENGKVVLFESHPLYTAARTRATA
jgi:hypothetical protein